MRGFRFQDENEIQDEVRLFEVGKGMQRTEDADGKGAKRCGNKEEYRERHHQIGIDKLQVLHIRAS